MKFDKVSDVVWDNKKEAELLAGSWLHTVGEIAAKEGRPQPEVKVEETPAGGWVVWGREFR